MKELIETLNQTSGLRVTLYLGVFVIALIVVCDFVIELVRGFREK